MNLGTAKAKVLGLMNTRTTNGTMVTAAQNADDLIRMNDLFNTAQMELAKIDKIPATDSIIVTADTTVSVQKYTLPSDFQELERVIYLDSTGNTILEESFTDYKWEGKSTFVLPAYYEGQFDFHYAKKPTEIPSATLPTDGDTIEFEVGTEAQDIMCYYVAGQLLLSSNGDLAFTFLQQYEDRKQGLYPTANVPMTVETQW
jgi:hypothetical protein